MKNHDRHTNELIAKAVGRFLSALEEAKDPSPAISGLAKEMCGIWLLGMWMLTQD